MEFCDFMNNLFLWHLGFFKFFNKRQNAIKRLWVI